MKEEKFRRRPFDVLIKLIGVKLEESAPLRIFYKQLKFHFFPKIWKIIIHH